MSPRADYTLPIYRRLSAKLVPTFTDRGGTTWSEQSISISNVSRVLTACRYYRTLYKRVNHVKDFRERSYVEDEEDRQGELRLEGGRKRVTLLLNIMAL
jgi:hypothetical protein